MSQKENKDHKPAIEITARDRLLRAWENSMELVRDFETYSKEINNDPQAADVFAQYAEEEGHHASKFREMLHERQDGQEK